MRKILDNVMSLREDIRVAGGGREVQLLPVTKNHSAREILCLRDAGIDQIGENRVQEWLDKKDSLPGFRLHMIGRLQTNKVRYIIGDSVLIHSVDRPKLLLEIQKQAEAVGICADVLLQVNIAGEEQKAGVAPGDLGELYAVARSLGNVRVRGLMTIAPLCGDPEAARPVFREARRLFESIRADGFNILSMGMSGDFKVAVEEGSTLVRIGSAVFSNGQ